MKKRRNMGSVFFGFASRREDRMKRTQQNRTGATLISIVVGLMLLSVLGATMAAMIHRSWSSRTRAYDIMRARYLAQSGVDYALSTRDLAALEAGGALTVDMGDNEQFVVTATLQTNDTYRIRSVGTTQVGSSREMHRVQMRGALLISDWDPDYAPPDVSESDVAGVVDDLNSEMNNWDVANATGNYAGFEHIDIPWLSSVLGGSDGMISTDMRVNYFMGNDPQDNNHVVGHQIIYFNKQSSFAEAWATNSYQLSYEAQVKMAWYKNRRYGAQGLVLMLKNEGGISNGKSDGYYVSFMRYLDENETGQSQNTGTYEYDGIPNSIKPPGNAKKRLLVVWKQEMSGGQPVRSWIAYKDLESSPGLPGDDAKDWVTDVDDGYSGQGFKDLVALNVRVVEASVSDKKYHYLQVLRADPKDNVTRMANDIAEDINENRLAYMPQGYGGDFPQWSSLDFDNWQATNDYFSLSRSIVWDGVNTNGQTEIMILQDNGTIRTEALPTPDSGSLSNDRYEVGLHATGNFNDLLNNEMYFDEFALRFLINQASTGSTSGGVSYHDE